MDPCVINVAEICQCWHVGEGVEPSTSNRNLLAATYPSQQRGGNGGSSSGLAELDLLGLAHNGLGPAQCIDGDLLSSQAERRAEGDCANAKSRKLRL